MAAPHLFSVFVGHIVREVTKAELAELFSGCGKVEDIFIVENNRAGSFNYGFVRFNKIEIAVKAVKDLHRWPLRGNKLVVDLAKDTFEVIQKGNLNVDDLFVERKENVASNNHISNPVTAMTGVNSGIKDFMYVSRVRETCMALDMDTRLRTSDSSELSRLDVDCLMEDISKSDRGRVSTLQGTLPEAASIENVKEKLMLGTGVDLALGREKVKDFVSALHTVMDTVNTFLKDHRIESAEVEDKCTVNSEPVTLDNEDHPSEDGPYGDTDTSGRPDMTVNLSLLSLRTIQEPMATDGSLSSSDDGETCALGGDSGMESDPSPRSPTGGTAFTQHDTRQTAETQVTSEPKKADPMCAPFIQNFIARGSLGRGRGLGRGNPPLNGFGRGITAFQGYGRGVGQTFEKKL